MAGRQTGEVVKYSEEGNLQNTFLFYKESLFYETKNAP